MVTHTVTVEQRDPVTKDLGFGKPIELAAGGWYAICATCGWNANNPHATKDDADDAKAYHLETAAVEETRATAVEAFHAATTDEERAVAAAAYSDAGRVG